MGGTLLFLYSLYWHAVFSANCLLPRATELDIQRTTLSGILHVAPPPITTSTVSKFERTMRNIALVTFAFGDNYQLPANITGLSKHLYAYVHGYTFYDFRTLPEGAWNVQNVGDVVWAKIELLRQTLYKHEWILWSDCDAMIIDYAQMLEPIIATCEEPHHICDLIVAKDWNGLNAGVFFLRRSAWTLQLLNTIMMQHGKITHFFQEQYAMSRILQRKENAGFWIYGNKTWFNAYPIDVTARSLILHYPSTYMANGRNATNARIEYDMEMHLKNTTLHVRLGIDEVHTSAATLQYLDDHRMKIWQRNFTVWDYWPPSLISSNKT